MMRHDPELIGVDTEIIRRHKPGLLANLPCHSSHDRDEVLGVLGYVIQSLFFQHCFFRSILECQLCRGESSPCALRDRRVILEFL